MMLETKLLNYTGPGGLLNPQYIDKPSILRWLINHQLEVDQYLEDKYSEPEDRLYNAKKIFNPYDPLNMMVGYLLVKDYNTANTDKVQKMRNIIRKNAYVTMCIGKKGGGKTALMAWLSETIRKEMEVYWLESNLKLPSWIQTATRLEEVEQGAFVVANEASVTANARDSMSSYNRDLSKVLAIARHQDLRVVFCSQHLNIMDINIYRFSDAWLTKQMQMTEVVDMQKQRQSVFYSYIKLMQPMRIEQTLFTDGNEWLMFENDLAPWWTDEISKGWRKLDKHEAVRIIVETFYRQGGEVDLRQLRQRLKTRGCDMTEDEIENAFYDYEEGKDKKKGSVVKATPTS